MLIFLHDKTVDMNLRRLFQIHSNTLEPHSGEILLSEPTMNSLHFERSAVLLIDHSEEEGTFGLIMNKPLRFKLNEVVELFNDFDAPVYLGGPVGDNQIYFVHTLGELIPDSCKIMEGLYWGGNSEILNTLIEQGIANKNNVRFFLGYSGWDKGQLVDELDRNSWAVSKASSHLLFSTPADQLWKTLLNRMGKEYCFWSRFPKNPEEN